MPSLIVNEAVSLLSSALIVSAQVLNSINAFRCMPVIGGMTTSIGLGQEALTAVGNSVGDITGDYATGGIRIEPTVYKTEYNAEISEQVLINIGNASNNVAANRAYYADNIAPHPRVWRITGYIPSDITADMVSMFPVYNGLGYIGSIAEHVGTGDWTTLQSTLKKKQDYLQDLFYKRKFFNFKTRDNEYISNAVMSQLIIERTPEVQNKLGIQVVIQEINLLSVNSTNTIDIAATASSGTSTNTVPINAGTTVSKMVSGPPFTIFNKGGVVAPQ